MRRRAGRAGFSMIEAMVAMAIAGIGLVAIFELQHQLTMGQRRAEQAMHRAELKRDMLSNLHDLNPLAQPAGKIELPPGERLRWGARPLGAPRQTTGLPVGDGPFLVQLYTVTAQITDAADHPLEQVSFDRLGWRKITPAGDPAPAAAQAGAAAASTPTSSSSAPF